MSKVGRCCACGYRGDEECSCPEREDETHCPHWWDGDYKRSKEEELFDKLLENYDIVWAPENEEERNLKSIMEFRQAVYREALLMAAKWIENREPNDPSRFPNDSLSECSFIALTQIANDPERLAKYMEESDDKETI